MNAEIIKVARKAATHFRRTDGYGQAAEIITMLCDELEKNEKPVSAPTVKDVLLKKYRDSDEAFASSRVIGRDVNGIIKFYRVGVEKGYESLGQALDAEIAYLNSASEVKK